MVECTGIVGSRDQETFPSGTSDIEHRITRCEECRGNSVGNLENMKNPRIFIIVQTMTLDLVIDSS